MKFKLKEVFIMLCNDSNFLKNCTFIKTTLMITVILYHSCLFWRGNWLDSPPIIESRFLALLSQWLGTFHIYAFTLVSGYIFAFKMSKGEYNNYRNFIVKKTKRLIVPYVFTAVLWVIPISVYFFDWDIPYIINKFVLCTGPSQLWFLWMLFDVFLIMYPLWNLMTQNICLKGGTIAILFWIIGNIGIRILPNVFCIWTACTYIPFFYIGMVIRLKWEKQKPLMVEKIHWSVFFTANVILFAVNLFVKNQIGMIWKLIGAGINFLLDLTGAVMAFVILNNIANKVNWINNKVYKTLSLLSMPMYLFHQQIIYFTIAALNGKILPCLNALFNFAAAFIGSLLISNLLVKNKITRKMIGLK